MVERFQAIGTDEDPYMVLTTKGPWVRHSDYAALMAEFETKVDRLTDDLVDALNRAEAAERALAERAGGVRFVGNIPGSSSASGFAPLTTEPAAPEANEAGRIGDAVLDWMVKFDLLDAGNEYYVSDVLAVLNDLTLPTRPSEQAVTEAMVEAAYEKVRRMPASVDTADGDLDAIIRAALKAAMEAGR